MSLTYEMADEPEILSAFVAVRYKEKENLPESLGKTMIGIYLPVCLCFESIQVPLSESHFLRQQGWEVEPKVIRVCPPGRMSAITVGVGSL